MSFSFERFPQSFRDITFIQVIFYPICINAKLLDFPNFVFHVPSTLRVNNPPVMLSNCPGRRGEVLRTRWLPRQKPKCLSCGYSYSPHTMFGQRFSDWRSAKHLSERSELQICVSRSCQGLYIRFFSNQYDQFSYSFSMVQDKEIHRKKTAWGCRKVILL